MASRPRKFPSQQLCSGHSIPVASLSNKNSTSAPVMYKPILHQHHSTSASGIHGYDTGVSTAVRSSSRDSGSSSSRTTSRTGSRGGIVASIATTAGVIRRGRNLIKNRPDGSVNLFRPNLAPLRNADSKGKYIVFFLL